uniref:Uncharacterized protein n=1 Tax=Helianthus annuus TaxID=4232 RepID=A0A251TRM8_HELAN
MKRLQVVGEQSSKPKSTKCTPIEEEGLAKAYIARLTTRQKVIIKRVTGFGPRFWRSSSTLWTKARIVISTRCRQSGGN